MLLAYDLLYQCIERQHYSIRRSHWSIVYQFNHIGRMIVAGPVELVVDLEKNPTAGILFYSQVISMNGPKETFIYDCGGGRRVGHMPPSCWVVKVGME